MTHDPILMVRLRLELTVGVFTKRNVLVFLQPVSSSVTITTLELFMPLVFIENNVEVDGD